jgi:hypothetical protein
MRRIVLLIILALTVISAFAVIPFGLTRDEIFSGKEFGEGRDIRHDNMNRTGKYYPYYTDYIPFEDYVVMVHVDKETKILFRAGILFRKGMSKETKAERLELLERFLNNIVTSEVTKEVMEIVKQKYKVYQTVDDNHYYEIGDFEVRVHINGIASVGLEEQYLILVERIK